MSTLRYQMGASIYTGSKHISSAVNVMKTHPDHRRYYGTRCITIHAEHGTLLGARTSVEYGTIYVARFKGETSRPCEGCMILLEHQGIENMVYMWRGRIVKELVR